MASQNFDRILQEVLTSEGGFVDDPRDPGGATNHGITIGTYRGWRLKYGLAAPSIAELRAISAADVATIYRELYWNPIEGDDLLSGLDYCVMDYAVNSGTGRAARDLQMVVGVTPDGMVGQMTIHAMQVFHTPSMLIDQFQARRLNFLRSLSTWGAFGRGWATRVAHVTSVAHQLARS